MTTITIATIRHNPKLSKVITADGDEFGFWTNKADKLCLEEAGTYNIEVHHWESKTGESLPIIIKAKRVTLGAQTRDSVVPFQSRQQTPAAHHGPAAGAPFRTPEQLTVTEIICAYISNGRCPPEKLAETIGYVRRAWNSHWGEAQREAAE